MKREESESFTFSKKKIVMGRMKPIPPTLKEKKRYIAIELLSEAGMPEKMVKSTIRDAVLRFLGELGTAKAGLKILEVKNNKAILSTNYKEVDNVRAALAMIKSVDNKNALVKTLGVSGTIKKIKNKFMGG